MMETSEIMGELCGLREYSSMSYCLREIPQRVRRGLSLVDVSFTCIDVVEEFITIGTNVGVIYWCNRKTNKLERLRPEKYGPAITALKVVSTVDYMVAAGDSKGVVSIFIVPKEKPIFLPADHENARRGIERFTASDLHSSPITTIAWSTNGQKLFTGDEKGVVAYTQMDFQLNIIKSMEILNEKFSIVQLAYRSQILLVASEYRCIIYQQSPDKSNQQIYQVGLKERMSLNKFGALIGNHSSQKGLVIFSARPKQRIWLANTEGNVCSTLSFKEAISQGYPEIQISRPFEPVDATEIQESSRNSSMTSSLDNLSNVSCGDIEFNYFCEFKNKYLVTHNGRSLLLLNPETKTVEAGFTTKRIASIAVNKDEIFVLGGCRRIRRISFHTDPFSFNKYCDVNSDMPLGDKLLEFVQMIKEETTANVVQSLKENFKKVENIVSSSEVLNGQTEISPAEEALNLFVSMREEPTAIDTRHLRTSYDVDPSCSDDIVHNRQKKKHEKVIPKKDELQSRFQETISCDNDSNHQVPEKETVNNTEQMPRQLPEWLPLNQVPEDLMPDLRSPSAILRDVEYKELLIAQLLKMTDELHFENSDEILPPSQIDNETFLPADQTFHAPNVDVEVPEYEPSNTIIQSTETEEDQGAGNKSAEFQENQSTSGVEVEVSNISCDIPVTEETSEELTSSDLAYVSSHCEKYWKRFRLQFPIKWICVSQTDIFCGSAKQSVQQASYQQFQLVWMRQKKHRASRMAVSQSGNILWKLNLGALYAYEVKNADNLDSWKLVARNVESVAVNDWSAWYVSGGLIFAQVDLSSEQISSEAIKVSCVCAISKVCCYNNNVWVLTVNGMILNRELVSSQRPLGCNWRTISHPDTITISDIALGTRNTGWIIDKFNNIYFSDDFTRENPSWWQIIIGRHIHRSDSTLSDQLSRFVHWSKEKPQLSVIGSGSNSIWISMSNENVICMNRTAILGHSWLPITVDTSLFYKTKWKLLAAVGENKQTASVWCLSSSNDLFLYLSRQNNVRAVEMPTTNDILCMTAVPDMMWILTDKNEIFVRRGISEETPYGWTWEHLHIYQVENSISTFKHLSIGRDVIWAISTDDKVYAAVADLYSITCESFVLDWIFIENFTLPDSKLIDVFVGPNKYMVWALDDKYNVYTRQSIFDNFPFGTEWVNVPGIKAIHLTVSPSAVWALTVDGYVYRRSGITADDAVGEYWAQVPGCLSLITASVYENIWGVSKITGQLLKYESHLLGLTEDFVRKRTFSENIEDEWEIVEDVPPIDED